MAVRIAEPTNSVAELAEVGLERDEAIAMLRYMLITRGIEERGHILYKQGKIPGSFYTGRGNEAAAVGTGMALEPEDVGTPTQRDLGVHIVRGLEPWRMFAQYMGRIDGPMRGRDGNVHMAETDAGFVPMVSHMGAMVPVAVGMALAIRSNEERRVAVTWFGEGASAMGPIHEGMNFAGVRRLPIVFICDNNQWAYSTPAHLNVPTEYVADRAAAYGFDGVVVDGTDVIAVYREAKLAVEKARNGGGPTLLECITHRMEGHGAHDDSFYVPREALDEWSAQDPVDRHLVWLREHLELTSDEEAEVTESVKRLLADAVQRAEQSPLPDPATVLDGVFAETEQDGDRGGE